MIKRITLLVRKDSIDRSEFSDYWHHEHGKIVLQMPAVAGYIQNPVLPDFSEDVGREPAFQFDGIVELWFADESAQAEAFASPAARLLPLDEPNFIKGITILSIQEQHLRPGQARTKAMLVMDLGASVAGGARSRVSAEIEEQAKALAGIRRLVANRVISATQRAGLWAESTAPDLLLELGTDTSEGMAAVLASPAFDAIRRRVRELGGRLAVRLVQERRVI